MPPGARIVRISVGQLRLKFNRLYLPRLAQLRQVVVKSRVPTPPLAFEPPGTKSEMVVYRDPATGERLAKAHRYLRPDGTLGGGGLPDPKYVVEGGTVYCALSQAPGSRHSRRPRRN
jgi:hypothetical protein